MRGIYDLSGAQAASTEYDVFGDVRASTGTSSLFAYTGEQHDPTTGFTHLRARDYDPATGRFTARDTVQPNADGTQGFNRYAYVANNPCSATDPSGHCLEWVIGGILDNLLEAMILASVAFIIALARGIKTGVPASAVLIAKAREFALETFILLAFCFWLWTQLNQPGMGDAGGANSGSPQGSSGLIGASNTYPTEPTGPMP